jgi:hypothetical protein
MGDKPVAQVAEDLGISDSCLRNWMKRADLDEGRRSDGLTSAEREELVRLLRELRASSRWRSSSGLRRTSRRRTCSRNDLRLHRRALLGSARLGVLPSDEGRLSRWLLKSPRVAVPLFMRRRLVDRTRGL